MQTGGNEGSLFAMGELLRSISDLCQQMGVTLILIHHTKKGVADPHEPPQLEHIAWSGFAEHARQWLLIGRRSPYVVGSGEHKLWLNVGGSVGHSALWGLDIGEGIYSATEPRKWEVGMLRASEVADEQKKRLTAEKESKHAERLANDKATVRQALDLYESGETRSVLRAAAGISSERFNLAIAELVRGKEAVPCEIQKAPRKAPYPGYKIAVNGTPP